jgi:hypothetical protein
MRRVKDARENMAEGQGVLHSYLAISRTREQVSKETLNKSNEEERTCLLHSGGLANLSFHSNPQTQRIIIPSDLHTHAM